MLLSGPITPEYQAEVRQVALRMMLQAHGVPTDVLIGAVVTCMATVLMKYGEGEKDVDAVAERIRTAIADTIASRRKN